jgi:YD repeat-containing protein
MTNGNIISTANTATAIAYGYDERSLLTSYTDTGDTKEIMESDSYGTIFSEFRR